MRARWIRAEGPPTGTLRRRAGARPKPLADNADPHYRWALATEGRGFARLPSWNRVEASALKCLVLVDAMSVARLKQLLRKSPWASAVSTCYKHWIPGTRAYGTHFTARLTLEQLDRLARDPSAPRWRLAMPLRDARSAAEASPKGYYGVDRDLESMYAENVVADAVRLLKYPAGKAASPRPDSPEELEGAIAVIDFGCPFLNGRFMKEGGTRVRALWDQGAEPDAPEKLPNDAADPAEGWPWQSPLRFGYGREMGPKTLDAIAQASRTPGAPEETAIYRGIDHLIAYADPRRRVWMATHGGHVLDVAGGASYPPARSPKVDKASSANLVFVQLPALTAADSAGVSLGAHLLDGVRYAMAQVKKDKPLVVVISYGNTAGPHDGESQIEEALAELLERRKRNFAIVLAAGNARDDNAHVRRTVRKDRSVMLRVAVAQGDTTDTFVEIWYDAGSTALEVRVRPPDRVWSDWVAQKAELVMRATSSDADVVAMIQHHPPASQGRRAMVMLALAPTARPPGVSCSLAEAGLWEVELRLASDKAGAGDRVELDAWIERDDPVRSTPGGRTRFLDQEEDDEQNTLSGIATGRHTIKAGGFNRGTGRPTAYSSLPVSGGANELTVLVACEEDEHSPSIAAAATRTCEVYRMNGTSVSAPMLARLLYNRMCGQKPVDREEWAEVLKTIGVENPATVKPFSSD